MFVSEVQRLPDGLKDCLFGKLLTGRGPEETFVLVVREGEVSGRLAHGLHPGLRGGDDQETRRKSFKGWVMWKSGLGCRPPILPQDPPLAPPLEQPIGGFFVTFRSLKTSSL